MLTSHCCLLWANLSGKIPSTRIIPLLLELSVLPSLSDSDLNALQMVRKMEFFLSISKEGAEASMANSILLDFLSTWSNEGREELVACLLQTLLSPRYKHQEHSQNSLINMRKRGSLGVTNIFTEKRSMCKILCSLVSSLSPPVAKKNVQPFLWELLSVNNYGNIRSYLQTFSEKLFLHVPELISELIEQLKEYNHSYPVATSLIVISSNLILSLGYDSLSLF